MMIRDEASTNSNTNSKNSNSNSISNDGVTYIYRRRNGKNVFEISSHSIQSLQPNKYLNDEVIQLYTAHLLDSCPPQTIEKLNVFDNIFHKLLMETFSDDIDVAKWKSLHKWFDGDIFEKDFLIFPACKDEHWFAIIVCYPSEVRHEVDTTSPHSVDSRERPVPGIIVLDSLGLNNTLVTRPVRDFLDFEWRKRVTVIKDFHQHNMQEYRPKLPKQTNAYDCGIFMLAYLKAFMGNPAKFYRLVRKSKGEVSESLNDLVNHALVESSRESIRNLIIRG